MKPDERHWRPITFQGVTFPPSLMGISILEPVLGVNDEDFGDWLWRFPICCGFKKSTSAERCARHAQQAIDLMLEQRQLTLRGIQERLGPHGFDAESVYRDWILALQKIAELSKSTEGDCSWSAPSHPDDPIKTGADVKKFWDALQKARDKRMSD